MKDPNVNVTNTNGGIGVLGLTFIVLLVLKLTGLATLSWWWVFAPILLGVGIVTAFLVLFVIVALVAR